MGPLHRGSGEGRHLHVHIETTLIVNDSVHYLIQGVPRSEEGENGRRGRVADAEVGGGKRVEGDVGPTATVGLRSLAVDVLVLGEADRVALTGRR